MLNLVLTHGSYALMFAALISAGFGVPIPDDIVLLAGGILSHRGITYYPVTLAVCFVGAMTGDIILFSTARKLGTAAYSSPKFSRFLPISKREKIVKLYTKHGGVIILVARHVGGIRAPSFAMAGIHGMKLKRFIFWDFLAMCIYAPLITGLGYYFSDRVDLVRNGFKHTEHYALIIIVLALIILWSVMTWRSYRRRKAGKGL